MTLLRLSCLVPLLGLPLLASCIAPPQGAPFRSPGPAAARDASAPVQPAQATAANWKERIEEPYLYLERQGDYRDLGQAMRELLAGLEQAGIETSGPPFALFFDDPARTPVSELRARACLPVRGRPQVLPPGVRYEILPRAMVAYSRVRGPYSELPRAYPELFGLLRKLGWQKDGPVREVYLVNPGSVASYNELLAEVQVPWSQGG